MWMKILLADKDPQSRTFASGILLESGCEVELAADEKEVLFKIEEFRPDIILLDTRITGTFNKGLISRVRKKAGGPIVKIIALAAAGMKENELKEETDGFDGYLLKPVDAVKLKAFVSEFKKKYFNNENRFRILCVDDEPLNIELLEAILVPAGYDIKKAVEGNEALGILKRGDIDLVLLDIMMPGMNGYEVCRLIKASSETARLPVIMITALSSKEDRIKSIEAGAEDFITKPFEKTEVLTRIKKLLEIYEKNSKISSLFGVLSGLADRGDRSAEKLKNNRFDFYSETDAMIRGITSTQGRGPKGMLVGTYETGWIHYDAVKFEGYGPGKSFPGANFKFLLDGQARVFYSSEGETESREAHDAAFALGKEGLDTGNFICRAGGGLCVISYGFKKAVNEQDSIVLKAIAMQIMFLRSVAAQIHETEKAYDYLVLTLARAAEANDEDTGRHILRVGEYAGLLAEKMGLDPGFVDRIRMQAQMHDVGKIHVLPEILRKPSALTAEEFEAMKLHTVYGAKIIGKQEWLAMGNKIAAYHHERWDGSGYPEGLRGGEIPLEARIATIADQYDALRNERVYKPAFSHEKAYEIMVKGDGRTEPGHFDPAVLSVFKEYAADFEKIYNKLKG